MNYESSEFPPKHKRITKRYVYYTGLLPPIGVNFKDGDIFIQIVEAQIFVWAYNGSGWNPVEHQPNNS